MAADTEPSFLEKQIADVEERLGLLKPLCEEYIVLQDVYAALTGENEQKVSARPKKLVQGRPSMDNDIIEALAEPLTTAEIADVINRPVTSVARACKRMSEAGKLTKEDRLWTRR